MITVSELIKQLKKAGLAKDIEVRLWHDDILIHACALSRMPTVLLDHNVLWWSAVSWCELNITLEK